MWIGQISPTDPPTSVLAAVIALGTVIVAGQLAAIRTLWNDNKSLRQALTALVVENAKQNTDQLRELLTVTTSAKHQMHESEQALEAAVTTLAQMAAHQVSAETLAEISYHLRRLARE